MYNRHIIVGRLGKDPETKQLNDGNTVVNFSVATTESWKDKNSGEKHEKTTWHNVVAYRKLAEIISQYLKKGSLVLIEGKSETRKWQDKDGHDRYTTEITASEMKMLSTKGEPSQQGADSGFDPVGAEAQQSAKATGTHGAPTAARKGGGGAPAPVSNNDWADDDIPFIHPWGMF